MGCGLKRGGGGGGGGGSPLRPKRGSLSERSRSFAGRWRGALMVRGTGAVDVLVMGGGPVGSEVALACCMLGMRVAVAEPRGCLLSAPTGWVSKTLRQLGRDHGAADGSRRVDWAIAEDYLIKTGERALKLTENRFSDAELVADGFYAPEVLKGRGRFVGPHIAVVEDGEEVQEVAFSNAFIAVGSSSFRLSCLPWEDPKANGWLFDGNTIKDIGRVPEKLVVQGGGTIATEYAFIMRALGAQVVLTMREERVMEGCGMDETIQTAVMDRMKRLGIEIRAKSGVFEQVHPPVHPGRTGSVRFPGGEVLSCDALLSACGRIGNVEGVDIEAAGCMPPVNGCALVAGETMRCLGENSDHIYAVGDCENGSLVSPLGLLSTGLAQAFVATHAAFPEEMESRVGNITDYSKHCPIAVWVEPTVAYVGMTSSAAEKKFGEEYGSVKVYFSETIKGCIQRAEPYSYDEFYKLVYHNDGRILGVHIYGKGASECIHNAATLVNCEATVWEVCRTVPPAVTIQDVLKKCCVRAAIDISARGKASRC